MGDGTVREKAEAEAIRLKAEAELFRQQAAKLAAETSRVAAETAALSTKAAAETAALSSKAAAETEAFKKKAAADLAKKMTDSRRAALRFHAKWALPVLGVALLAADYYVHENKPYLLGRIKRRLKEKLAAARAEPAPPPQQKLLPVPGEPLTLVAGTPTMVLAPTGAGKSTLLKEYAAKRARDTPTVLMHFRRPADEKNGASEPATSPAVAMDEIASHIFRDIDYPQRQSVVGWVLRQPWAIPWKMDAPALQVAPLLPSSTRLIDSLQLLFQACADIYREERAAKGAAAQQCVLLFDEVQDLTKDERLVTAGGRVVFKQLSSLLCSEGVDHQTVLAAVAGSSAELDLLFNRTVMRGNRWDYHLLLDPEPGAVVEALVKTGMAAPVAQRLVDALGTRVRLLNKALTTPGGVDAGAYLEKRMQKTSSQLRAWFSGLSVPDTRRVGGLLDTLASGKTAVYDDLPQAVKLRVGETLYVDLDQTLRFQSALHERVWKEGRVRAEVMARIRDEKMQ